MRIDKLAIAVWIVGSVISLAASAFAYFYYIGCYADFEPRDLNGPVTSAVSMTNEFCSNFCFEKKFPYFGTQAGTYCFCGTAYGSYGAADESSCNMPCVGNAAQKCGGSWRNSLFGQGFENGGSTFTLTERPSVTALPLSPLLTVTVRSQSDCLMKCEARAGCAAVLFSPPKLLCHLLNSRFLPASLSGSVGEFLLRR